MRGKEKRDALHEIDDAKNDIDEASTDHELQHADMDTNPERNKLV